MSYSIICLSLMTVIHIDTLCMKIPSKFNNNNMIIINNNNSNSSNTRMLTFLNTYSISKISLTLINKITKRNKYLTSTSQTAPMIPQRMIVPSFWSRNNASVKKPWSALMRLSTRSIMILCTRTHIVFMMQEMIQATKDYKRRRGNWSKMVLTRMLMSSKNSNSSNRYLIIKQSWMWGIWVKSKCNNEK